MSPLDPSALFLSSQCPDTGIQHFTQSHQERCILHNTFMLTNLIKFLDPSVKHWDDTIGALPS
ncbi:hypothetical protein [Wolbachia endosymbiont (group A) of Paraperithous gnathaulax]|uniref:hypothetical protein n=1 Tax=Wolbachia endosymbiont (group A) of Paraperithous gnathaulax TaxID=3066212 RepID=UPI0033418177